MVTWFIYHIYTLLHLIIPYYTLLHPITPYYTLLYPIIPYYTSLHNRFIENEDTNFALFNFVNEQNNQKEDLEENIQKVAPHYL